MLVTLADMKTYLGITGTDYDVFLTQQITLISDTIEEFCSRKFASATYIQTFYKEDYIDRDIVLDTLTLYHFPLISVTSVKEKSEPTDPGLLMTDYRLHKPTAKVIRNKYANFFCYGEFIEVEYTSGYAVIPSVIQNVVYSLVQERYNKKINGIDLNFGSDVQSVSIPGTISIAYDYSLQDNERKTAFGAILGKYVNTLDHYRSERVLVGEVRLAYL